jgi:uncharacterized protein (TIGR02598 family)
MKKSSPPRSIPATRNRETGFSLVETALALGILSFAFVGLLGVIPVGLNIFANAINATVESQIVQRVTTVARQTKFSQLSKLDYNPGQKDGEETPDFYFNEQGTEVVEAEEIKQLRYVYTAAVVLQPESGIPASSGAQSSNPNLATLNIIIKRISAPRERRMVSALIANNGT